ncbi:MAG: aspartyl protease family protein [bacterium]
MGEVIVELEIENYDDRVLYEHNLRKIEEIRRERVRVLVDSGSTMLVLPQDLVEQLGLKRLDKVIVTYADERKEEREVAGVAMVRVENRITPVNCVVGPPGSEGLLGQTILEELDLIVDCKEGKLRPRPESPYLVP